jgi:hypothetical protein
MLCSGFNSLLSLKESWLDVAFELHGVYCATPVFFFFFFCFLSIYLFLFFSGFLGFASIFYLVSFSFSFPFAFSLLIFPLFFQKKFRHPFSYKSPFIGGGFFFSFRGGFFGSKNRWRPINGPGQASGSFQELSGTE